jgi:hypothetical protein
MSERYSFVEIVQCPKTAKRIGIPTLAVIKKFLNRLIPILSDFVPNTINIYRHSAMISELKAEKFLTIGPLQA